jgi:16S rRNA (cytidine1402-2'-O)-methyltransferase
LNHDGGTLHVVATPIGNLEDITLRALRVLREVAVIAAEDTRRSARLLARHGIVTPTISYHEHNWRARTPGLLGRLRAGQSVALVTDAGTPSISDPGVELIRAALGEGITINPVPGANAPLTAAVASGFPLIPLTILGFPPSRSTDRKRWVELLNDISHTITLFESPTRILDLLKDLATYLGDRPIMVGRELTKVHQQFMRGSAAEIAETMGKPKGEFTVVIGPVAATASKAATDEEVLAEFGQVTREGASSRRQAILSVSRRCCRAPRDVYAVIERAKSSV